MGKTEFSSTAKIEQILSHKIVNFIFPSLLNGFQVKSVDPFLGERRLVKWLNVLSYCTEACRPTFSVTSIVNGYLVIFLDSR